MFQHSSDGRAVSHSLHQPQQPQPKPQQQHPQQQQQLQKQPQQLHEDTVQDWQRSQPQPIQTRQRLLTHTFPTLDGPLSPLDAIVRNGKQARRDVGTRPNLSQDLLSRAHSLSRSTSVKVAHPREVTEEPDGDDSHIPRAGPSSSRLAQSHQAGPSASPALIRRESVDTVRSSEFGEDGRWAQAWTKRPDDEESLFNDSDSQWDGESYRSVDVGWSSYAVPSEEHEYAQARAALQVGVSDLNALSTPRHIPSTSMQQPRNSDYDSQSYGFQHPTGRPEGYLISDTSSASTAYQHGTREPRQTKRDSTDTLREARPDPSSSQSATQRPILGSTTMSSSPERTAMGSEPEHQPSFHGRRDHDDSGPSALPYTSSAASKTSPSFDTSAASPLLGRVREDQSQSLVSNATTDIYGQHAASRVRPAPVPRANTTGTEGRTATPGAYIAASRSSSMAPRISSDLGQSHPGHTPYAPATLLSSAAAGHHIVPSHPTASETAALRSPRGHPTGRMPPPPPSADSASGRPTSGMYHDPNAPYGQPLSEHDWTASLGKHRAAVLAAHDGRASLVSDLDVETLRLDGSSSRRSSTSTLALANQTSATPSSPTRASQGQRRSGETWRGRLSGEMQRANAAQAVAAYEQSERALQEHNAYSAHGHQAFTPSGRPGPALPSAPSFLDPPDVAAASYTSHMRQSDSHGTLPSSRSFGPQPTADAKSQSQHTVGPGRPQANAPLPPRPAPKQVSTSEELLSRGIEYHEAGDLVRSSLYFERSAKVEGGCVVGMCMYGMALREGWGAKKDQRRGFEWIQAAATRAGETLKVTQPRTDAEMHALKSELKLSVYELGKCYCYGWGVKLDKRMALEYFELAAKLGDADAQAEAGALYATGKGCKKDLKKAARYYRMAEAQGYDTVGLSWIHKDKYL